MDQKHLNRRNQLQFLRTNLHLESRSLFTCEDISSPCTLQHSTITISAVRDIFASWKRPKYSINNGYKSRLIYILFQISIKRIYLPIVIIECTYSVSKYICCVTLNYKKKYYEMKQIEYYSRNILP